MKKAKGPEPSMRKEYDFSGGTRGKFAGRFAEGTNVVVLDPDVAEVFSDGKSVSDALRALAKIVREQSEKKRAS